MRAEVSGITVCPNKIVCLSWSSMSNYNQVPLADDRKQSQIFVNNFLMQFSNYEHSLTFIFRAFNQHLQIYTF